MTLPRVLGAVALIFGVAAPLAGDPPVARAAVTVAPIELATWIRDRKPGLRVIDLRSPAEFNADQVPTAENFQPAALAAASLRPDETIVLYGAPAAGAWSLLRERGVRNVLVLDRGIDGWLDDVMSPVASTDLTRYFGGVARPAGTRRTVRRGC